MNDLATTFAKIQAAKPPPSLEETWAKIKPLSERAATADEKKALMLKRREERRPFKSDPIAEPFAQAEDPGAIDLQAVRANVAKSEEDAKVAATWEKIKPPETLMGRALEMRNQGPQMLRSAVNAVPETLKAGFEAQAGLTGNQMAGDVAQEIPTVDPIPGMENSVGAKVGSGVGRLALGAAIGGPFGPLGGALVGALPISMEAGVAEMHHLEYTGASKAKQMEGFFSAAGIAEAGGMAGVSRVFQRINGVTGGKLGKAITDAFVFEGIGTGQDAATQILNKHLTGEETHILQSAIENTPANMLTGLIAGALAGGGRERAGKALEKTGLDIREGKVSEKPTDAPVQPAQAPEVVGALEGFDPETGKRMGAGNSQDVSPELPALVQPPGSALAELSKPADSGTVEQTRAPGSLEVPAIPENSPTSSGSDSGSRGLGERGGREPIPEKVPPASSSAPSAPAAGKSEAKGETKAVGIKHAEVDATRKAMGLPEAKSGEPTTFEAELVKAKATLESEPMAGRKLVDDLSDNPRAQTAPEKALLAIELTRRVKEHEAASKSVIEATDDATRIAARAREARALDEYDRASQAAKLGGSASGLSLGMQRIMLNHDYSLAAMKVRAAVKRGKALSEAETKQIEALHDRVTKTREALDAFEARNTELQSENDFLRLKRQVRVRAASTKPNAVVEFISARANEARVRIKERGARAFSIGDPLPLIDHAIIGAEYLAKDITAFAEWSKAMVSELGEHIRPHLQAIFDKAKELHESAPKERARLQSFKTRTARSTAKLEEKIATGDFSKPPPRRPIALDKDATALKVAHESAKQAYQSLLLRWQRGERTKGEVYRDTFLRWSRAFVLSSPNVLVKLPAAGTWRIGLQGAREAIGAGVSKVIPRLAAKSPIEAGGSVRALSKQFTEGFTQGMRDAWDYLRTGKSDLEVLFEKKLHLPPEGVEYIGALHGALKSPFKRAGFEYAMQKQAEFYTRQGFDIHEPALQLQMSLDAYKFANRQIFLQDNVLQDAYKIGLHRLEMKNKETGRSSAAGQVLSTGARAALPITKIPTNIAAEIAEHVIGSVTGSIRAAQAYRRGIETLKPAEADAIMRQLKNGVLGAAGLALGWSAAKSVGGFYEPGKRNPDDPEFETIKVFGVTVPSMLIHNPAMETIQVGATLRRASEKMKHGEEQGIGEGALAASIGVLESVPFFRETADLSKVMDPNERDSMMGRMIAGRTVPQVVQWVARHLDTDEEGNQIKRKAKGLGQNFRALFPGLRQALPRKPR